MFSATKKVSNSTSVSKSDVNLTPKLPSSAKLFSISASGGETSIPFESINFILKSDTLLAPVTTKSKTLVCEKSPEITSPKLKEEYERIKSPVFTSYSLIVTIGNILTLY